MPRLITPVILIAFGCGSPLEEVSNPDAALALDASVDAASTACPLGYSGDDCSTVCSLPWSSAPTTPISTFVFGENIPYTLWNDPAVLKEGSRYRMWVSGGDPRSEPIIVKLYEASSDDGETWTLDIDPQLEPGAVGEWDDTRVETPTVVQDGDGTYHLYYSGHDANAQVGVYSIGHATSTDGKSWMKDPANPVITIADANTPSDWGVFTVAEPAAVYNSNDGKIYVYYTSAGNSLDHQGDFGILLATSVDGSTFAHHQDALGNREPVYTLSPSYPTASGFRGYSTPAVALDVMGTFHLVHDVVANPPGFDQVAIAFARSEDGVTFDEVATDLVKWQEQPWLTREVRAPFLLIDDDEFRIWFAGGPIIEDFETHQEGIAEIVATPSCP